jgi:hypothetical protein
MRKELSHASQTVRLQSLKPNPTRASPYSSGSRWLNRLRRERSQGSAAMCCLEEACQRYSGGCRVGPECRVSLPRFGEALGLSPLRVSRRVLYGYSLRATRVVGDVTWRQWLFSYTGDYPTPSLSTRVMSDYKVPPKCLPHAAVTWTSLRLSSSGIPAKAE